MIHVNKVEHFGVFHCIACAGAFEFNYTELLPYGNIHNICCPHCNNINTIDILGGSIYHRLHNPLDGAFQ